MIKRTLSLLCILTTLLLCVSCASSKNTVINRHETSTAAPETETAPPTTEPPTTQKETTAPPAKGDRELDLSTINGLSGENVEFWFGKMQDNGFPAVYGDPLRKKVEQYDGILFGDTNKKELILTFDCGYEYQNLTDQILDVLKEKGVKATFFITMDYVKDNEDKVARMIAEGHEVGNHSTTHPIFATLQPEAMKAEIMDLHDYVVEHLQYEMKFFRFPTGAFSEKALEVVRELGYTSVFWSFAYADWDTANQKSPEQGLEAIQKGLHNGAVILLHAVSSTNATILGQAIDYAKTNGYQFIPLP